VAAIFELSLGAEEDARIGYALPAYDLSASPAAKTVYIPWSKFAQPNWTRVEISIAEAVKKVASVNFRFQAKDGTKGEFNIMQIGAYNGPYYSNCPGSVPPDPILPKSSSSETVIPKSSSSYDGIVVEASAIKCGGFVWGGYDDYRIDTECDAGGNTSGIWFSYTDSTDKGESVLTWAVRNEFSDYDPEFEDCYGVCGKYTLDKGRLDYDPFVGVGFNLGGTDEDGNLTAVDATGMQQICIDFSSTHAAIMEMGLTDELEKRLGYALPAYDLGKSATGKSVCIPWKKFAQPSWAEVHISAEEAVKALVSLRIRVQAKTGSAGILNITNVGTYW
jgi:predicted RNA-binding protein with PUA-like domain